MNVFGIDILQLIIYACVAASFIVVVYILKLTRKREEPESETTTQLIMLLDKYVSHQLGLKPGLHGNPSNPNRKRKPQAFPNTVKVDEDSYEPGKQAKKVLDKIRQKMGSEE